MNRADLVLSDFLVLFLLSSFLKIVNKQLITRIVTKNDTSLLILLVLFCKDKSQFNQHLIDLLQLPVWSLISYSFGKCLRNLIFESSSLEFKIHF